MRLLIADPARSVGDLVRYVCKSEGVECEVACDAESLMNLLKQNVFDVICLSPSIDKKEGIQVLQEIRQVSEYSFTPIFLFTSSPSNELNRKALALGATDVIEKSDFEGLAYFLRRFKESQQLIAANILVVEDSPLQQQLFSSLLTELGCQVDFCDSADEAFETYNAGEYDLVITDIVLKGMLSGVALAGRIRRLQGVAGDVPILAVTGYDDPSREASLYSYGVSDYLRKPIDVNRLSRQVKRLVKAYQQYKELVKSSQALADSDKQRLQFWANISHEIRAPLNGIVGSLQLIERDDVVEPKQKYFDAIKSSSEMLLSLINDVLSLSKSESGQLKFTPKNAYIKKVIENSMGVVEALAFKKGVSLSFNIDPEIPELIECDVVRLSQVLNNLLHNAVKFTAQGEVKLSCQFSDDDAQFLEFSVTDGGIGIAKSEHSIVFDKFKQANSEIEGSFGGTGIGLHISKLIVAMWNGKIGLESELHKGSRFWFTMPLKAGVEVVEGSHVYLLCEQPQEKRILVVDDSNINLMITEDIIKTIGLKVDTALSGKITLEKVKQNQYDLIFMDCQMPEMDGMQTTNAIRQLKQYKDTPIIALSAECSNVSRETCLASGMNDYFEKPIELDVIVNVLNQYL
jgi:CheY-like chemotaxis protein/two-component sensor histidine kinase